MLTNATSGGAPPEAESEASADAAGTDPAAFLAWDAELPPPRAPSGRRGVLIVAQRPGAGLPARAVLPAVVLLLLSAGLLGARVARTDWFGRIVPDGHRASPPDERPAPTPTAEPIPLRIVVEPAAPAPAPEIRREGPEAAPPAAMAKRNDAVPPPVETETPAPANPAAPDPMAAIQQEAARRRVEQDAIAKLKDQIGRDMPPPPPRPPARKVPRKLRPGNLDQLVREMQAVERRQLAAMQRFLEGQDRLRQAAVHDLLRSLGESKRPGELAGRTWPPALRIGPEVRPARGTIRFLVTPDGQFVGYSQPSGGLPPPPPPPRPTTRSRFTLPTNPVPPPPTPAPDLGRVQ